MFDHQKHWFLDGDFSFTFQGDPGDESVKILKEHMKHEEGWKEL